MPESNKNAIQFQLKFTTHWSILELNGFPERVKLFKTNWAAQIFFDVSRASENEKRLFFLFKAFLFKVRFVAICIEWCHLFKHLSFKKVKQKWTNFDLASFDLRDAEEQSARALS